MENTSQKNISRARGTVLLARFFLIGSFFALVTAWLTQITGGAILGLSQQHLFSDSMALSLIAIVLFLDAAAHAKNL